MDHSRFQAILARHGFLPKWERFEAQFFWLSGMIFNLQRILRSKRSARERLAQEPIIRKLRMMDSLREREIAIRVARRATHREGENADPVDDLVAATAVSVGSTLATLNVREFRKVPGLEVAAVTRLRPIRRRTDRLQAERTARRTGGLLHACLHACCIRPSSCDDVLPAPPGDSGAVADSE